MKLFSSLAYFLFLLIILQGCNTLYNSHTLSLEIVVPAKIQLLPEYKKIALKYNNCNVNYHQKFAEYYTEGEVLTDQLNTDSLAAEVYFQVFSEKLNNENFFDSIIELEAKDFTGIKLVDSLITPYNLISDSILISKMDTSKLTVYVFNEFLKKYPIELNQFGETKIIDPEFGLYSEKDIKEIAYTTNSDLLLSLDYFASTDGIDCYKPGLGIETIVTTAHWNIYDLHNKKLKVFYHKVDTISWEASAYYIKDVTKLLPPRKDAILNAADIAASRLAEVLSPHWIEVERMYYRSGHVELKKTDQLIKENNWMDAAEIWKNNTTNPNKKIASKCMFNLGLACEMQGDIEAALDWVVKSYYIFKNSNEVHAYNCMSYIRILGQRKLDLKNLEVQLK